MAPIENKNGAEGNRLADSGKEKLTEENEGNEELKP
jgi:hypothetical protein